MPLGAAHVAGQIILAADINAIETAVNGKVDTTTANATYVPQNDLSMFGIELPEKQGAAHTYNSGVDDTAFVQAALTAAVAAGRQVLLSRLYKLAATGVTASGPVSIVGIGGQFTSNPVDSTSPTALSGLVTSSGTAVALTCAGRGTVLRDFAVINSVSAAPTAGAGIRLTAASQADVSGVSVVAFYNNIETSGVFFTIRACHFYDAVNYSVWLNNSGATFADHGDLSVVGCVIAQNYKTWGCTSAIRWTSGGGVKILGNKILGGAAIGNGSAGGGDAGGHFSYGIDIMAGDGVNTGDLNVTGNSISNFNIAGVRVGVENAGGTAGQFVYATITGNNINVGWGTAVAMLLGAPTSALSNNVRDIEVSSNNFENIAGGGIVVYNITGIDIGRNHWGASCAGPLITLAGGTDNGVSTLGASVAQQSIGALTGVDIVYDLRRLSAAAAQDGGVDHTIDRNFYANSVGTWVTLGYFDLPVTNGGTAELELLLTGYDFGVGPMFARYRRILSKASGTNTVTVAADGTDATAGAGSHYAVQFVTTTNDRVIVQVQLTSGSPTIWGRARMAVRGDIARSHKGA